MADPHLAFPKVNKATILQQYQRAEHITTTKSLKFTRGETMPHPESRVQPPFETPLSTRLRNPQTNVSPPALAANWFDQTIRLRLDGCAGLIDDLEMLNHFRRSFGGALGAAASASARANLPCPWSPPCALDVFFREQLREDGIGMPKPFVMLADHDGDDLIASLRLFGFATDWMPAAEHAFIAGLREVLPWQKLGRTQPAITDRQIDTCDGISDAQIPETVTLHWLTPLDAEKIDPANNPISILTRLHRRAAQLGRWHDVGMEDANPERWQAIEWDAALSLSNQPYRSQGGQTAVNADGALGDVTLSGDLAEVWPLLRVGERSLVGRGAVRGRGRYELSW